MVFAQADGERVEKIEVTGSYIKRVDLEGAQPIQTIDREYLDQTGYNSVSDVLREMSANSFGSGRETSGSVTGGTASVSLRGLGAQRTLILLNGRRLAKDGVDGTVDLNLIPMAAVERIDILKDSSAALYGSDAMGGVINVITKKDYSGGEVSIRYEMPEEEGGKRTTISGLYGFSTDKLNVTTSIQYRSNKEIYDKDREWSNGGESTFSPTPNIIVDTNATSGLTSEFTAAGTTCQSSEMDADGNCIFDYTQYSTNLPQIEQVNILSNMRYEIDGMTEVHALLQATKKDTWYRYAPGATTVQDFNVPAGTTVNTQNGQTLGPGTNIDYARWRSLALGTRDTEMETTSYGGNVGITRYFGDTWEADFTMGTQRIDRDTTSPDGYVLKDALKTAISNGTCNIFGDPSACSVDKYVPWQKTKSRVDYYELRTNGELFDLPAGPVGMAVGGQHMYESYSDGVDTESRALNVSGGGAYTAGSGTRHSSAVFTELAIPVMTGLDVQVAGRYDKYSDFGDTFNPKISVMYKPVSALLFRASAGTGFKAPTLTELYRESTQGSPSFVDEVKCANKGDCEAQQYQAYNGGNSGLKQEKSKNYSVGAVVQATKDFSFSLDYWHIKLENVVGVSYRGLTLAERNGVNFNNCGTNGSGQAGSPYNTCITRSGTGEILEIRTQLQNLSEQTLSGIDFSLQYNSFFKGIGNFTLRNEASYMLTYDIQQFPGLPIESQLDLVGAPKWRNNLTMQYAPTSTLNFSSMLITTGPNFMSDYKTKKKTYTRVDLQGSYIISAIDATVSVGIKNILGTTPPLDLRNPNGRLDDGLYDNIGRRIFLSYAQRF